MVRPGFSGKLTLRDLKLYLTDPTVIEEEEKDVSPWAAGSPDTEGQPSG